MTYELPKLQYAYDALEPYIDARTMEIHHFKHHTTYTEKFNVALKDAKIEDIPIEDIFKNISKYPTAVRNNGGGYYNHSFYWASMAPAAGGGKPRRVQEPFGSSRPSSKTLAPLINSKGSSPPPR